MFAGVCLFTCVYAAAAQQAPVPVDHEPHHHVVLQNDYVLVMRVNIPAHESTLYHTHSHDRASIDLNDGAIELQELGHPESVREDTKPGKLTVTTVGKAPLTHQVRNVGTETFDVLDVEFLQRPVQSSTSVAAEVAGENLSARAYHWTLAPGAASCMHTHIRPYLIVSATPMMLKMSAPDGQTSTHQVKAGDFHWIGSPVTHSLANAGAAEGQIVELELK
jgi:quercetin dioxygenase-like cupin family protein